ACLDFARGRQGDPISLQVVAAANLEGVRPIVEARSRRVVDLLVRIGERTRTEPNPSGAFLLSPVRTHRYARASDVARRVRVRGDELISVGEPPLSADFETVERRLEIGRIGLATLGCAPGLSSLV